MKITFNYAKRDPSKNLEELVTEKLTKLQKYAKSEPVVEVYFKADGKSHNMKVIAEMNGHKFPAVATSGDMYSNIDACVKKLKTQIIRAKAEYRTDSRKINQKVKFSDKHNLEQMVPASELE
jgi:ribosomal subunit interface protein